MDPRLSARLLVLALLLLTLTGSTCAHAADVPRRVLALYDSTDPYANTADTCLVDQRLAMPLNRLGFAVDYHDLAIGLPPTLAPYYAIACWPADERMADPAAFLLWLTRAVQGGTRLLLMGNTGAEENALGMPVDPAALAAFYAAWGLAREDDVPAENNPFALRLTDSEPGAFDFETSLPPANIPATRWQVIAPDVRVWRESVHAAAARPPTALVAVGPRGGWVADGDLAVRVFEAPEYRVRWDLNPFAFLEAALDCKTWPRPDVTTVMGARAAFSHIDGDGQLNMTMDLPGPVRPSAKVVLDEVLAHYPVPVTVGLIVGRTDPAALGAEQYLPLWREIMARPNVQAGCHGYAHPLNWAEGRSGMEIPGYTFDEAQETVGAMEYLRKEILPDGERVEAFLWTGDCAPVESTLRLVREYGTAQVNGGDPRLDAVHDSVTFLCPLTRVVGRERQVHAAACNEYIYTEGWLQNYSGFRNVIETFKRTATPRYLPVNIYYHFYSGEKQASLRALKDVYDWAVAQPLCWIHAAEYARAVEGFDTARFQRTDAGWRIETLGTLRTVRFDHTEAHVDLPRSTGVLGYTHHAGSLYVTLSADAAELVLSAVPSPGLSLVSSTSLLRDVVVEGKRWRCRARVYVAGALVLRGFSAGQSVPVRIGGHEIALVATHDGLLRVPLPQGWGEWLEVTVGY